MTITVPILVTKEISITILTTITITLTKPLSGNQGFFVGIVFNPALPKEVCHHHSLQACTQAHILTFKYIGEKFMLMYAHWFWSNSQCKPVIFLTCRRKYKSCSKFKVYKLPWSRSSRRRHPQWREHRERF